MPRLGSLHGRRLAILGFGSIGVAVAQRALPFGMEVRGLRRTDRPSEVAGVELVGSVAEAVDGADHVVVAAPLTPATRHLIDDRALAAMKPGVHLVNIARGGLVDQAALRVALDDGHVALASLDAVDPEPLPEGHWLFTHPRVRLSAHDSWSWPGANAAMFERFAANLRGLAGRPAPARPGRPRPGLLGLGNWASDGAESESKDAQLAKGRGREQGATGCAGRGRPGRRCGRRRPGPPGR